MLKKVRTLHSNPRFRVVYNSLDEKDYYYVEKPDAVVIVLTCNNRFIFCHHHRPIVGTISLELIGGRLDHTESALDAAKREAKEEVGIDIDPIYLFEIMPLPSVTTEKVHVTTAEISKDQLLQTTKNGIKEGIGELVALTRDEIFAEISDNNLSSAADGYAVLRYLLMDNTQ